MGAERSSTASGPLRRVRIGLRDEARALLGEEGSGHRSIAHALDPKERVRCGRDGSHGLVVIRVPRARSGAIALETIPIGLVVDEGDIVVVATEDHEVVDALRALVADRDRVSVTDAVVVALQATARSFAAAVDRIETAIDAAEERLASSLRNTEVLELLRYQKALVHHSAALHALIAMLERLPHSLGIPGDQAGALGDVHVELRQTVEIADLERQTLSDTMDAFASIIANNLNDVMRALAAIAIVLTPPVVMASLWGMNVPLPWSDDPQAFWVVLGLSAAFSVGVAIALRARRWL